jgi:hypothetical protein
LKKKSKSEDNHSSDSRTISSNEEESIAPEPARAFKSPYANAFKQNLEYVNSSGKTPTKREKTAAQKARARIGQKERRQRKREMKKKEIQGTFH